MKALTITEALNFKRGIEPADAMSTGLGPEKYIEPFEKIIEKLGLQYRKTIKYRESWYEWEIRDKDEKLIGEVLLVTEKFKDDEKQHGWMWFASKDNNYYPDPYGILEKIIKRHWDNIDDQISHIQENIDDLEDDLAKAKNHIEKLKTIKPRIQEVLTLILKQK